MRLSKWAISVVFGILLAVSGQASAFELDVAASPERQDVLYPFNARIDIHVDDASTGAAVKGAHIVLSVHYSRTNPADPLGPPIAVHLTFYKKTNAKGYAKMGFKTGGAWVDTTISYEVRVRKGPLEGYTTGSVDVINP